jgi:hypothetical protein
MELASGTTGLMVTILMPVVVALIGGYFLLEKSKRDRNQSLEIELLRSILPTRESETKAIRDWARQGIGRLFAFGAEIVAARHISDDVEERIGALIRESEEEISKLIRERPQTYALARAAEGLAIRLHCMARRWLNFIIRRAYIDYDPRLHSLLHFHMERAEHELAVGLQAGFLETDRHLVSSVAGDRIWSFASTEFLNYVNTITQSKRDASDYIDAVKAGEIAWKIGTPGGNMRYDWWNDKSVYE